MASNKPLVPKEEIFDFGLPSDTMFLRHVEDGGASSSGSNIRSFFIDMGFLPSLVDKVIDEKGEDDVDLLLETLTTYSAEQKSVSESSDCVDGLSNGKKANDPPKLASACHMKVAQTSNFESSDSLDSLFDDKDASHEMSSFVIPKEEDDEHCDDSKRASLLMMKFAVNEVDFAIDKLGGDAPLNDLVDFIIAAQVAEKLEKETDDTLCSNQLKKEENDETLFLTMEKTLRLLEMGFSENQVSLAIEKFGSDTQISELADSIVTGRIAGNYPRKDKYSPASFLHTRYDCHVGIPEVKAEESSLGAASVSRSINMEEIVKGKRPKEEQTNDLPDLIPPFDVRFKGKRPKQEYYNDLMFFNDPMIDEKVNQKIPRFDAHPPLKLNPSKSLDKMVAKHPYFLYGNVLDVPHDSWVKISKFLYDVRPEFVNTQSFSALSRKEGYVHNLPAESRFHILPKPAMTIQEAIPLTQKWWPSWDSRKQLSYINSETRGVSQLCDRLSKMLTDSRGQLSSQQQRDIHHHCIALNLVWISKFKLAPIEPQHLERILGYPIDHTQDAESSSTERLQSLKYCFQTDTLGYYLSVLKPMFPEGLTVLSIFSGIGGAEVALQRLGIHLKAVISVESSAAKRKMMLRWWRSSGQTGELEQLEDIHKLTSNKIHNLLKKFGGFDLVVCHNPCSRSSSSKMGGDDEGIASFDFSIFCEFVRVLQSVRNSMERKR